MLMGRFGREMLRSAAHRPFLHEAISGVLRNLIVHRCAQYCKLQRAPLGGYQLK